MEHCTVLTIGNQDSCSSASPQRLIHTKTYIHTYILCVYICIYASKYRTCVCLCIYMHARMQINVNFTQAARYAYTHTHTHTHTHMCVPMYVHTWPQCLCHMQSRPAVWYLLYTHTYVCVPTYICICVHTYIHSTYLTTMSLS